MPLPIAETVRPCRLPSVDYLCTLFGKPDILTRYKTK